MPLNPPPEPPSPIARPTRAIIMAGGRGQRLRPYTWVFPKPLMPIGQMSVLELILRQLAYYGFTDVTIAIGYMAEYIRLVAGDGMRFGLNIAYVQETQALGTAGALSLVSDLAQHDQPFLVLNGDLVTSLDFRQLMDHHLSHTAAATIATYSRTITIGLGVLSADATGQVTDWVEKPSYEYQISMGINVLTPALLRYIQPDQRLDLPDLIRLALRDQQSIVTYPFIDGYWLDIGRLEDYEQALNDVDSLMPKLLPNWTPNADR